MGLRVLVLAFLFINRAIKTCSCFPLVQVNRKLITDSQVRIRHTKMSFLSMTSAAITSRFPAGVDDAICSNFVRSVGESQRLVGRPKIGFLLLNLGGPETSEDVEGTRIILVIISQFLFFCTMATCTFSNFCFSPLTPEFNRLGFLYNLFADPDIIRLPPLLAPLQSLIALGISKRRAPKSKEAYNSIGGGSPILKYSRQQRDLICQMLKQQYGLEVKGYIGMRYWHPFTKEALDEIRKDNITELVILPLYPQFSISTSGSSLRALQEEFAKHEDIFGPSKIRHTVVASWYDRPGYIASMSNLINEQLESFSTEELRIGNGKRHVLFSAHGFVPLIILNIPS